VSYSNPIEQLYQEELYNVGPKVLVIIPTPWEIVSEEDQLLLSKILVFIKQSLSSVQIITLRDVDVSNLIYRPIRILSFGSRIRFSGETLQSYKLFKSDHVNVLQVDTLGELDAAKKKILQNALKDMFQL
jgi:hypothetical protein